MEFVKFLSQWSRSGQFEKKFLSLICAECTARSTPGEPDPENIQSHHSLCSSYCLAQPLPSLSSSWAFRRCGWNFRSPYVCECKLFCATRRLETAFSKSSGNYCIVLFLLKYDDASSNRVPGEDLMSYCKRQISHLLYKKRLRNHHFFFTTVKM